MVVFLHLSFSILIVILPILYIFVLFWCFPSLLSRILNSFRTRSFANHYFTFIFCRHILFILIFLSTHSFPFLNLKSPWPSHSALSLSWLFITQNSFHGLSLMFEYFFQPSHIWRGDYFDIKLTIEVEIVKELSYQ
jgi:hypothetical protein